MSANHTSANLSESRDPHPGMPAPDAVMGSNFMLTNPEAEPHEPESVGELLRAARESAGFSIAEVANRLRMGSKQIDAIERADYAALPQGIFLRGFIRNYAKVVGVDGDAALAILERTHTEGAAVDATKVVAPTAAVPVNLASSSEAWSTPKMRALAIFGVLVLLAAAAWYWWQFVRPHLAEGGRPKPPARAEAVMVQPVLQPTISQADPSVPSVSSAPVEAITSTPLPTAPAPAGIDSPPAVAATVAPVAPSVSATDAVKAVRRPGDTGQIGFTFSGPSWVEVVDGTSRTILSRRYNTGDFDEVSGRGPFAIVVGNSSVTRMAYNGREFDLKPHIPANSTVARVTVK